MRKIGFGADAYVYLREELASGNDLASALLKLPLENGSMWGYFPDEVNSPDDFNFKLSIFLTTGINIVSELEASTIALMAQYLEKNEGNYAIFETFQNSLSIALYSGNYPLIVPYIIYKSNIYLMLSRQNAQSYDIAHAISNSTHYPFVCALISLPDPLNLDPKSEIDRDTLEMLVKHPDYIFVGAYDDEGCVIWESHQAKYQISL